MTHQPTLPVSSKRMRWSRPVFNIDAYRQGRPAGARPCGVCAELAVAEYCDTIQSPPGPLAIWVALCREHADLPLRTWQEATEEYLQPLLFPAAPPAP